METRSLVDMQTLSVWNYWWESVQFYRIDNWLSFQFNYRFQIDFLSLKRSLDVQVACRMTSFTNNKIHLKIFNYNINICKMLRNYDIFIHYVISANKYEL